MSFDVEAARKWSMSPYSLGPMADSTILSACDEIERLRDACDDLSVSNQINQDALEKAKAQLGIAAVALGRIADGSYSGATHIAREALLRMRAGEPPAPDPALAKHLTTDGTERMDSVEAGIRGWIEGKQMRSNP